LKRITVVGLLVFCLFLLFGSTTVAKGQTQTDQQVSINVHMFVRVLDINPSQKTANVNFFLYIDNCSRNVPSLNVQVFGGGVASIICNNLGEETDGWGYSGESNETIWFLEGYGETYPFDSYVLRFAVLGNFGFDFDPFSSAPAPYFNFSLSSTGTSAFFAGPKAMSLEDLWGSGQSHIPLNWGSAWISENRTTQEMSFSIQRSGNALNTALLEFLVPIIACYFLLASTLILDPRKNLNERIAIYIALFVFVPTFLIAIQNYLPYRSSLSFPELLLTNLVIGTTILGVFSIVGKQKDWTFPVAGRFKNLKIHHNNWDLVGVIMSLLFLALTYYSTLYGKIAPAASFIFSYFVIPAYVIWFPFENIKSTSIKKNKKSIIAFSIGTTIITACSLLAWFFPASILVIGAVIAGLFIGLYLRKVARSALIGFVSGVLSVMFAGILVGMFPAQTFLGTGLTAVYNGVLILGLYGYPVAIFAALFGILGALLTKMIVKKKKLRGNHD
jgi:energy-converting hydrogenase Eha subunit A